MVESWSRSEIIHNLDVKDMLVNFFGAQMHMTFRSEGIEWLQIEYQAAESILRHFILNFSCILLVLNFVSNKELYFITLH